MCAGPGGQRARHPDADVCADRDQGRHQATTSPPGSARPPWTYGYLWAPAATPWRRWIADSGAARMASESVRWRSFYSIIDETEPFRGARSARRWFGPWGWRIRDVESKPPTLIRKTGTGDMNVIGNQMNDAGGDLRARGTPTWRTPVDETGVRKRVPPGESRSSRG